jgi:lysophospholipase L1-like esterase
MAAVPIRTDRTRPYDARIVKVVLVAFLLLAGAAPAAAQEPPLTLEPYRDGMGYLGLHVTGPAGATVTLSETTGGVPAPLGQVALATGQGELRRAARWRCSVRHRTFHAEARTATGAVVTADAARTTPRCRKRFSLHVRPSHPRAGRPLTVLLVDRWKLGGIRSQACARGPAGRRRCRTIALADGRMRAAWRFRPGLAGRWRIQVRTPGAPTRRDSAFVRPRNGRLSLLATGDSMIQIIDALLGRRLQTTGIAVHSDARISTGITKPFLLDWPLHARVQARQLRPDVTVVFIGANDGFPLRSRSGRRVLCCGRGWAKAYARKASGMMSSYARHGAGTVYWATLPAPRDARFRHIYRAVNAALRDAARRHPGEVHIVPLARRFTPGYRFRQSMRWQGRVVSVRQGDGIHLNVTGASIAATIIVRAMRRDGVI